MKKRKTYDKSNRPVQWRDKRAAWVESHQGKHVCLCGCGKVLKVSNHNYYTGIPDYWVGHSPNSVEAIRKFRRYGSVKGEFCRNTELSFWKLVDKSGDGCWLWKGYRKPDGYGRYSYKGRFCLAHRLSFFFWHGRWPKNNACHTCDNPPCVNPQHLFDGTQKENSVDAAKKGRLIKKFQPAVILEVVRLVNEEGWDRKQAALHVGMSPALAVKILAGHNWGHLTGIKRKAVKKRVK